MLVFMNFLIYQYLGKWLNVWILCCVNRDVLLQKELCAGGYILLDLQ